MRFWLFLFFAINGLWAQKSEVSNTIAEANDLLKNKEGIGSEMEYRKALSKNPSRVEALYNLGNNH